MPAESNSTRSLIPARKKSRRGASSTAIGSGSQDIVGSLFEAKAAEHFRSALLEWFALHKRDLPWRRSRDAYAIWVSEIMLQQTRVAAVLDHYRVWIERFPTLDALASAAEEKVLAAWSGLGYYRRARYLHAGAKAVMAEHHGQLPRTAAELRRLPGIGAYTSAAIASIAFGEATAVVDGNVERVLLRQAGCGESLATAATLSAAQIRGLAGKLLDPESPGDFNQAMMELGATICLPRNPLCLQCPVQASCRTRGEHPTRPRTSSILREACYGLLLQERNGDIAVLLQQRPANASVMPGMWELPSLRSTPNAEAALLVVRHAIMQVNYRVTIFQVEDVELLSHNGEIRRWVDSESFSEIPLTGLARKILKRLGSLDRLTPAKTGKNPVSA